MSAEQFTPTGLLAPAGLGEVFTLERFPPANDLRDVVLRYWLVTWRVAAQVESVQELLPYPCVNIVVEPSRSGVFGVTTGRSQVRLQGEGRAFGIKFQPGAFYPFHGVSLGRLTNTRIGLASAFGVAGEDYERGVRGCETGTTMVACAEAFLRERRPPHDPQVTRITSAINRIAEDRTLTRVAAVAADLAVSQRTLQRLFNQYVGVGPKWVIRRFRLLEAVALLEAGQGLDLASLATTLGYFDQAHFSNDFRAMVGRSPAEYLRSGSAR